MNTEPPKPDWLKIMVHAVFGALGGAMIGVYYWARWANQSKSCWTPVIFVGGGALLGALFAGAASESKWDEK